MRIPRMWAALVAIITACVAVLAVTTPAGADRHAGSSSSARDLARLAQRQTNLLLKFYQGQNVSPLPCGRGQDGDGVDGVFLLPVLAFTAGDRELHCTTRARSVLVDLGGFAITADDRFPASSYVLNGRDVPFTRGNLEPICDDLIAQGAFNSPAPGILDGDKPIKGTVLDSGVFTAKVNRLAQIPGGVDLFADSVDLGHPGRLATVFCGTKAIVHLSPGSHTIVVDYGFPDPSTTLSTVFTYHLTVTDGHDSE